MARMEDVGAPRENRIVIPGDPIEQGGARRHPVLDHLVQAGAELASGERAEDRRIDDDRVRLIEGADEVLAHAMVHADLAADGAVDLRQQRRRHVHEGDASEIRCGREPRQIADHAPPERHDAGVAVGFQRDELIVQRGGLGQ